MDPRRDYKFLAPVSACHLHRSFTLSIPCILYYCTAMTRRRQYESDRVSHRLARGLRVYCVGETGVDRSNYRGEIASRELLGNRSSRYHVRRSPTLPN